MKDKMKNYSFWIAIASSVMIFLQTLGTKIDLPFMDNVLNAFLGIFVVLGFVDKPKKNVDSLMGIDLGMDKSEDNENVEDKQNKDVDKK